MLESQNDLRRINRAKIIKAVREAGQASRTEIVAKTGLSHATVSSISGDLIAEGVLSEPKATEAPAMRRGRPQVAMGLNLDIAAIVTVELSINSLAASLIDYAGNTIREEHLRLFTLDMSPKDVAQEPVAMVQRLLQQSPKCNVKRIMMSVQGVTDVAERIMLWSPIVDHGDMRFADLFETATGVPTTVENDTNLMAFALKTHNGPAYANDFIAVSLSHGVGMGFVRRGDVFSGSHSSGGEFGHMMYLPGGALCRCGRNGCVEAYAGNYAIWRNAGQRPQNEPPRRDVSDDDVKELIAIARDRPGPEREAFRIAGEALGFSLGSLFALIDPAPAAFIGGSSSAFDLMEPALRTALASTAGGQRTDLISFVIEPDAASLTREGCAKRALSMVDDLVFAAGG